MNERAELSSLIAPVKDRMFATVWRILRHSQDAEDALQNALVTLWRRRSVVRSHPSPHALILRICADAAIDQFRRRGGEHVDVDLLEDRLPSADASPLEDLIEGERLDIVMTAISRLSAKQSAAIVMKYVLGEAHADIAEALGCSPETVREHLARGRQRLERMLGHLGPECRPTQATTPVSRENEQ